MFEAVQKLAVMFSVKPSAGDRVFVFSKNEVWMRENSGMEIPLWQDVAPLLPAAVVPVYLGKLDGERYFALLTVLPETGIGSRVRPWICRRVLPELHPDARNAFCRGRKLAQWAASHRFCGVCKNDLQPSENDLALICPACAERYYPQLAPAVIVAITRNGNKEILLAHNRNFAGGFYSLIAGFVEAGESVEDAVKREVMEECGIKVRNIRYFTSQVWPFPNSLMLAFTAEYESGNAVPDGEELTDLGWFTAENHPQLPSIGSVARHVIEYLWGSDLK